MTGRLVLLATSHRVAPGLLTLSAWQLLQGVDRVVAVADHPLTAVLADADIPVESAAPMSPGERATWLLQLTRQQSVVWLVSDDGDVALTEALAPQLARAADEGTAPELEVVHGSFDVPGARMLDLVSVMDRLRSPGGCPWDAEQTHVSLAPYLLEETYEVLESIDAGDRDGLREELGDLLLQVVFHARVAEEDGDRPWSVDDVAADIVAKLVRRHPHVFADGDATTSGEVEASWEQLKAAEKRRDSVVDGVPMALPALALASKLVGRAVRGGVEVEIAEPDLPDPLTSEDLGLILLGLVSAAHRRGLDPESALRQEVRHFAGLVRQQEQSARH
jgi:XTP/dITP diphosphohydrolase